MPERGLKVDCIRQHQPWTDVACSFALELAQPRSAPILITFIRWSAALWGTISPTHLHRFKAVFIAATQVKEPRAAGCQQPLVAASSVKIARYPGQVQVQKSRGVCA